MEEIIKLQIKTIRTKLTVARAGKKEMLEAKLKGLEEILADYLTPSAPKKEKPQPKVEPKEELSLAVQKEIKEVMVEVPIVEKPKEIVNDVPMIEDAPLSEEKVVEAYDNIDEDVIPEELNIADIVEAVEEEKIIEEIKAEELPTVEEVEKEIEESEPIIDEPKEEVTFDFSKEIVLTPSVIDGDAVIDTLPKEEEKVEEPIVETEITTKKVVKRIGKPKGSLNRKTPKKRGPKKKIKI